MELASLFALRGKPQRVPGSSTSDPMAVAASAESLRSRHLARTRGFNPAIAQAVSVVVNGVMVSLDEALALEVEAILELVKTDATLNLIRYFQLQQRARKLTVKPDAPSAPPIDRVFVVGAGIMGGGIAQWLSAKGCSVTLCDLDADLLAKGLSRIERTYEDAVKRGQLSPTQAQAGIARIVTTTNLAPDGAALVIEAAAEKMDVKRAIFTRLGELSNSEAILATNTSALSVSEMAAAATYQGRILGAHFFNPVARMPLVEISRSRETDPAVLQRAVSFIQKIGKLPVVVRDSPGFIVNRVLFPYLIEALRLCQMGARVEQIDEAMLEYGMPMGPLRLLDEIGLDVCREIALTLTVHFGHWTKLPSSLEELTQVGCLGRKSGRGFYVHGSSSKKPAVNFQPGEKQKADWVEKITSAEWQQRLLFPMINEAARCLEEEVAAEPADIDFAMMAGTGFPAFRGGPLRYADSVGIPEIFRFLSRLTDGGAKYFVPCRRLCDMADQNQRFYPKS
jgi:3-hydroxyacyl-CoA dehydrogenase/enoyl-CoA hydratase/3-hydroxybutyryl-CoA epimerase